MEQPKPTGIDQPTVQQMFATLLGEIATLRRQNDDQQRQLEHLQNTTSLLLQRDSVSLQTSGKLQFKHLPLEIREMIWEFAMPSRLLAFNGVDEDAGVPFALSIPAVAHVCRESRRVFAARKQYTKAYYPTYVPPHLWRLKQNELAYWTTFRPHTDALLINPLDFLCMDWDTNYAITWVAEHIIVESGTAWGQFQELGFQQGDDKILTDWVGELSAFPEYSPPIEGPIPTEALLSTRAPVCNLRTIDLVMSKVTRVDHNYPPNLVHRLFAGDSIKIVDLRDKGVVERVEEMIDRELFQVIHPTEHTPMPMNLSESWNTFRDPVTRGHFSYVKRKLLRNLVRSYYNNSVCDESLVDSQTPKTYLQTPFRDGKWDMEVPWVKELCKRIDVRPVHVFIRSEGISAVEW